jgi:hypothetical protein
LIGIFYHYILFYVGKKTKKKKLHGHRQ